ncbi:hypothetical protein PQX77_009553 [Marasmius sp. AFHP31]|nr:hypothetical protein PQX77_009553 [Marasmius sp. AFHP31]
MMILLSWYLLARLVLAARGQELSVPSFWGKTSNASREERINATASAIDAFLLSDSFFVDGVNSDLPADNSWPYGELLARLADFDILTNQTKYKDVAQKRYLPALERLDPKAALQDRSYAYAATRAYLAYQDEGFLRIAKDYWSSSQRLTISQADVQSSEIPGKPTANSSNIFLNCTTKSGNFTFVGATLQDGVPDGNDLWVTLISTAGHLSLTVALADIASDLDQTYIVPAQEQADFMRAALYKGNGMFRNWIRPDQKGCPSGDDRTISLFDAGSSMQALSAFALASKNSSFMDIIKEMAQSSTLVKDWNTSGGVLDTEMARPSTKGSDAEVTAATQGMLRSYYDLVVSDDTSASDLRTFLRAYLDLQYAALTKRAPFPSNAQNLYGKGLLPDTRFNADYQLLAITTLLGGVISGDNVTSSDSGGNKDSSDHTTSTGSGAPVGAIVGGVVGGILGLLLIAAGFYYYLRRRRQSEPLPIAEPYSAMAPSMASSASPPVPTSSFVPFRSGKYERRVSVASPASGIAESTTSASITNAPESRSSRVHEATTAELVTILNQRLRNERWNANDSPPEYHRSVV